MATKGRVIQIFILILLSSTLASAEGDASAVESSGLILVDGHWIEENSNDSGSNSRHSNTEGNGYAGNESSERSNLSESQASYNYYRNLLNFNKEFERLTNIDKWSSVNSRIGNNSKSNSNAPTFQPIPKIVEQKDPFEGLNKQKAKWAKGLAEATAGAAREAQFLTSFKKNLEQEVNLKKSGLKKAQNLRNANEQKSANKMDDLSRKYINRINEAEAAIETGDDWGEQGHELSSQVNAMVQAELGQEAQYLDDNDLIEESTLNPNPEFTTTEPHFRDRLDKAYDKLSNVTPTSNQQKNAKDLGLKSLVEADRSYKKGEKDLAQRFLEVGEALADVAVGWDPITGTARSLYESITGKNMITGEKLGTVGRTFAVLGVFTAGYGAKFGVFRKVTTKVLKSLGGSGKVSTAIVEAGRVLDAGRKLGVKTKEGFREFLNFAKRSFGNEVGSIGKNIGNLVDAAQGTAREVIILQRQLQRKFKHAADFGVIGNPSNKTLKQFAEVINEHVKSPGTRVIKGTYRGNQNVIHYIDAESGLNVIKSSEGKFISGWKLSVDQLRNLLERGNVQ